MTVFVVSTMTQTVSYNLYDRTRDVPILTKAIRIKGGTGISSARSGWGDMQEDGEGRPIWTADGFVTPVSDADYEILKTHKVFLQHEEGGHVKVLKKDITDNYGALKRETRDMERDGFQPMNEQRLKTRVKVTTQSLAQQDEFRL